MISSMDMITDLQFLAVIYISSFTSLLRVVSNLYKYTHHTLSGVIVGLTPASINMRDLLRPCFIKTLAVIQRC